MPFEKHSFVSPKKSSPLTTQIPEDDTESFQQTRFNLDSAAQPLLSARKHKLNERRDELVQEIHKLEEEWEGMHADYMMSETQEEKEPESLGDDKSIFALSKKCERLRANLITVWLGRMKRLKGNEVILALRNFEDNTALSINSKNEVIFELFKHAILEWPSELILAIRSKLPANYAEHFAYGHFHQINQVFSTRQDLMLQIFSAELLKGNLLEMVENQYQHLAIFRIQKHQKIVEFIHSKDFDECLDLALKNKQGLIIREFLKAYYQARQSIKNNYLHWYGFFFGDAKTKKLDAAQYILDHLQDDGRLVLDANSEAYQKHAATFGGMLSKYSTLGKVVSVLPIK